ncbi:MAG: type IX secretion system membrane protein PorP/SprF [Bacteroidetes bacterium]|nr:type IX secretion system membrane protein PorP/SprF [Bacteroidota bacterium]
MRKIVSILILVITCFVGFSQQDPQVSLNMYNQLTVNPAYAGCNEAVCGSILHRNQWLGFSSDDGSAPRTDIFNVHGAFEKFSSGVGLVLMQESIGFESNLNLNLAYSYRIPVGKSAKLSLGLSFGMFNKSLDGQWRTPDMLDQDNNVSSPFDDPAIPYSESKVVFDAGFGAFFRTAEGLYIGLSSTHLPQSRFKFSSDPITYLQRHYYLSAGYYWQTPSPLFVVKPGLFIKSDGQTVQYDINALVEWKKMAWGGISYRVGDAFVAMAGVHLPMNLRIAIAYDFTTSALSKYSSGSIEVMVNYCFTLKIDSQRGSYKSVRFL